LPGGLEAAKAALPRSDRPATSVTAVAVRAISGNLLLPLRNAGTGCLLGNVHFAAATWPLRDSGIC
jgi:hypothetical protein